MGQNYNLPKKEDAKVPQCPPEKEAAIKGCVEIFSDDLRALSSVKAGILHKK